jgi:hypothetical protein
MLYEGKKEKIKLKVGEGINFILIGSRVSKRIDTSGIKINAGLTYRSFVLATT